MFIEDKHGAVKKTLPSLTRQIAVYIFGEDRSKKGACCRQANIQEGEEAADYRHNCVAVKVRNFRCREGYLLFR